MSAGAWAQENMCIVPTSSGQALTYPVNWESTVVLTMGVDWGSLVEGTLPGGQCVGVKVNSDGFAKPPFTLEIVSGDNFYFNTEGGQSQIAVTDRDGESIDLCAENNACGTVAVSISDEAGMRATSDLRSSNGDWKPVWRDDVNLMIPGLSICGDPPNPRARYIYNGNAHRWLLQTDFYHYQDQCANQPIGNWSHWYEPNPPCGGPSACADWSACSCSFGNGYPYYSWVTYQAWTCQ